MSRSGMKQLWKVAACVLLALAAPQSHAAPEKVFRYAFPVAETGFDPAQISDLYSRTVTPHIFEGMYTYDHLARPYRIKPLTAEGMPQVSSDHKVWTVRLKPGIHFSDDPAFKGVRRELVAADYAYAIKRFFDPAVKSPSYSGMKDMTILGLDELRQEALKSGKPFDYDRAIPGIELPDRYTIRFRLAEPRPRFIEWMAGGDLWNGVAREVVEFYGDRIMEHPVGTGPFVLKEWRRSSKIVLERNPGFREMPYDAEPNADDAEGQALLAKFRGRRLPMVDRVEVSIIDENQPRWLAFLQGQLDLMHGVPLDFANQALPNGKVAPNLARRGITLQRMVNADVTFTYFNMEDPVVGGYAPEKVALRRAIGLGTDIQREIKLIRRGQAIAAQAPYLPHTSAYEPDARTTNSEYDPARAKALLEMYGYVDRDGDGWREQPDGSPMVIEYGTTPDQISRQFDELWKKNMDAIGVRMEFRHAKWPEHMKAARAGRLQVWGLATSADRPDGGDSLQRVYGPAAGGQNLARFKLAEMDRLFERTLQVPDGPERMQLFRQARNLILAYAPYHYHVHRIVNDMSHPWLSGFRRPPFWQTFWQYVDVDPALRERSLQ
jgi:ABC-type transport system substrate-binding protein